MRPSAPHPPDYFVSRALQALLLVAAAVSSGGCAGNSTGSLEFPDMVWTRRSDPHRLSFDTPGGHALLHIHPSQSYRGMQAPLGTEYKNVLIGYEQRRERGRIVTERVYTYRLTARSERASSEDWRGWVRMPDVVETAEQLDELDLVNR